jgi:hypothetical protein
MSAQGQGVIKALVDGVVDMLRDAAKAKMKEAKESFAKAQEGIDAARAVVERARIEMNSGLDAVASKIRGARKAVRDLQSNCDGFSQSCDWRIW